MDDTPPRSTINLDISRAAVTPEGVEGFEWPLARKEVLAARDALVRPTMTTLREAPTDLPDQTLRLLALHYVIEVLEAYQACALARRFDERGITPKTGPEFRLLQALLLGEQSTGPPRLEHLRTGLRQRRSWVPQWVRSALWGLRLNGWKRALLRAPETTSPVALHSIPLLRQHARRSRRFVRYRPIESWFPPLTDVPRELPHPEPGLVEELIGGADLGFRAGGEAVPETLRRYLTEWVRRASGLTVLRLQELLQRVDTEIHEVWIGSGGSPWTRSVGYVARSNGGTVTGHEHGMGAGHLVSDLKTLGDLQACDRFVTYTEAQAESIRHNLDPGLLITDEVPEVVALRGPNRGPYLDRRPNRRPKGSSREQVRTIIYPASFYNGGRMHYGVQVPDLVALDWEARLFHRLRSWGFRVLHKPHPASVVLPPPELYARPGVEPRSGPFEEVMEQADLVLTIMPQSTAFAYAMTSGIPIVYVDLGLFTWRGRARQLFEERAVVVQGRINEANRLCVDWTELRHGIDTAPERDDTEFERIYLGSPTRS